MYRICSTGSVEIVELCRNHRQMTVFLVSVKKIANILFRGKI